MTSLRKKKAIISRAMAQRRPFEDRLWDQMRPVGREFGSPDFERLMDEDRRNGVGVFDPALKDIFLSAVKVPGDVPVQRRRRL